MENLDPAPPPKSRMGKWRVFGPRAVSSLIWGEGGFAVPFYFVQDCSRLFAHLSRFSPFFSNKEPGRFQSKRTIKKRGHTMHSFHSETLNMLLEATYIIRLKSLISDPRCFLLCLPIKFDSLTSFHFLLA